MTVLKCVVCKERPRAISPTKMCRVCIGRLDAADLIEFDNEMRRWYGHADSPRT